MTLPKSYLDRAKQSGPLIVLVLLIAAFLWTGSIGLDFGLHWDEALAFEEVTRPLETGVFLPRSYNYASMLFDIGTVALLPTTIPFLIKTGKEATPLYSQKYSEIVSESKVAPLVNYAKSKAFHLRFRWILVVISSLTGLWVFLAVRACQRSGWEAVFATAVILTSWEIAYHSRWVAPDALQMQFGALWLVLFALALNSPTRPLTWLRFSAAAAGLAAGTKYQGGFLFVPVIAFAVITIRSSGGQSRTIVREIFLNTVIFSLVFLMTTPGFILEPLAFWQSVRHIGHQYSTGHYGYTVNAFGQHGYLLFCYLSCVLGSPWLLPAAGIFLMAVLGLGVMWKERPMAAILLMSAPLLYGSFAISFRVMMVRNYLLLAPFIAFFSARGAYCIWKNLVTVWLRSAFLVCLIGIFAANTLFLWIAARTIIPQKSQRARDVVEYLTNHPNERFYLSRVMAEFLTNQNVTLSNTTENPNKADRFLFHSDEADRTKFICNRPFQYRLVSGRLEVNFNYYADWEGQGKVFDVSMKRANEMHLFPQEY